MFDLSTREPANPPGFHPQHFDQAMAGIASNPRPLECLASVQDRGPEPGRPWPHWAKVFGGASGGPLRSHLGRSAASPSGPPRPLLPSVLSPALPCLQDNSIGADTRDGRAVGGPPATWRPGVLAQRRAASEDLAQ